MNDPARAFAVVAAVAGVLLAIAMPPSAAPDETRHLSRVWLMSEGIFRVPGKTPPRETVPKSIPELYRWIQGPDWQHPPRHTPGEIAALLATPIDAERTIGVANAGTYPPTVYLPHLAGVAPGRWLGLSPAALIYLGRFASLAAWIALTAWAIHLAPARQWTLAVLSLTPMAVASAAAVSADPMTNAAVLLCTVALVRAATGEGALRRDELAALFGGALALAAVKPGYAPLLLAALAIPPARTGGRARQLALFAGLVAAVVVPTVLWTLHAQSQNPAPAKTDADPAAQLAFLLASPLAFPRILAATLADSGASYWTTFVGQLGPMTVKLPGIVYAAWLALLAAVVALDGPPLKGVTRATRTWFALAALASIVAMFGFAYLGWNPVGAPIILGVQGRYWAPVVPLLVFALPAMNAPMPRNARIAAFAAIAVTFALTVIEVVGTYYAV